MFSISSNPINTNELLKSLENTSAGALVSFEGWVRDHNIGKKVLSLEYQVYEELAVKEGQKILNEALQKFDLKDVICVHRQGHLYLGDMAVWIAATAVHRDAAFRATRYIIDEIKHRLPIWKKEYYHLETPTWVFCRDHHHHNHISKNEYYEKQKNIVDQNIITTAKVLVVGAGGLGCPVLTNLALAGVGKITVVDFDKIELNNIHRQSLYAPHLIGEMKVDIAKNKLQELNPFIEVQSLSRAVQVSDLDGHDLIIDCTDNWDTKFFLHDHCFKKQIPLVSASVYKNEGQLRTFSPGNNFGCWRCYQNSAATNATLKNCNDFGVLGVTTNYLGAMQASEALEFLQNKKNSSLVQTLFFNLKDLSQFKVKNNQNPDCLVCKGEGNIKVSDFELTNREVPREATILDIRELSDLEVENYKDHKSQLVLCCHKGIRSKYLAEKLRQDGHHQFYSLKGGHACL